MSTVINQASIQEITPLVGQLEEFAHAEPHIPATYLEVIDGKKSLMLLATRNEIPAGFLIAYDKYNDGSLYCWRAGVLPQYRRQGVLKSLMSEAEQWARKQKFHSLKLITRNSRREMLAFLVNNDFRFTEIIPKAILDDYRICAEKVLSGSF